MITLKDRATNGKIKILKIWTEDNKLCREFGYEDGKKQKPTPKACQPKNVGKANATTGAEQAILELEALVIRKVSEGYRLDHAFEVYGEIESRQVRYPLPESFTPSKPINSPPGDVKTNKYCAQRKWNGVNILALTDETSGLHFYTRRIKEITNIVENIPELQALNRLELPPDTLISLEFIYINENNIESPKDLRGVVSEKTTSQNATARYKSLPGLFLVKVFDILMYKGNLVTDMDFIDRYELLRELVYRHNTDLQPVLTKDFNYTYHTDLAKNLKWEGYILRKLTGPASHIKFTFNGKASRAGAWKLKFFKEDDFFIYETQLGDSGRLAGLPSKFHLGKYDEDGNTVDCGWCGTGKLMTEELQPLSINLGLSHLNHIPKTPITTTRVVAEIKYSSEQLETNSLEHPVFMRVRHDKLDSECLI